MNMDYEQQYRTRKFGEGSVSFIFSYPGYPSYLPGVIQHCVSGKYLPKEVLGFTNGKDIVIKKGLSAEVRRFVQLHEEEHVKDMTINERETDMRALARLGSRNKKVMKLLKRRWLKDLYGN